MEDLDVPSWINHIPVGIPLDLLKYYYIIHVLRLKNGNRSHAARELHVSLRTIRNQLNVLRAMGIAVPPPITGYHTGESRKPRAKPVLIVRHN